MVAGVTEGPDRLPPSLARELARQYDIVRLLGRGGMGVVFLARERSLDRLVAIKVLSGDDIELASLRERFRREARIAARLVHPNIVPLHAFGETEDALYFVMGYVEGETLSTRLNRDGRVPLQAASRILREIADALAFAHREGVVHRDVKPENILLDAKSGRAMLADFGVARVEGVGTAVTMTGLAIGTPGYMSPEQAMGGKDVDGRSDIYALGVVGYRMLMGRLPFTGGSVQELMAQHALAKPDDLALAVAPAERPVAHLIMRALEKDPDARWPRAEDFREELDDAARRPTSLPEGLQRVEMLGTKLLLAEATVGGILYSMTFWTPGFFAEREAPLIILGNLSLWPLLGLGLALPTARKHGWLDTFKAMFHPPEGWSHWWPKFLRRPDNLWDRLPKSLRRLRNVLDIFIGVQIFGIVWLYISGAGGGGSLGEKYWSLVWWGVRSAANPLVFPLAPFVLQVGWVAAEFVAAKKKLGLTTRSLWELLGLPQRSDHPGWAKPKFARLLAPETAETPAPRVPQTPMELESAIRRLSKRLHLSGLLPEDGSVQAAVAVRAAIEALEADVQQLHQDLDPAESERLERRLAALKPNDDPELRKLLESQRAVIQRLRDRRQEKEARRDRLRASLTALWMQLVELNARVERGAPVDPELTGSVRALSADLTRTGDALTDVERMLPSSADRSPTPV